MTVKEGLSQHGLIVWPVGNEQLNTVSLFVVC